MNKIANSNRREREDLFLLTARDVKLPESMVEKDFWVCWTLDYLFHKSLWAEQLAFKGGTSLSKCFGLIERFSEDIDLILDWRVLGYTNSELWAERSKTSQDKLNKEIGARTEDFLRDVFLPQLKDDFAQQLSEPFELFVSDNEPQTIFFAYPKIFDNDAIKSVVRLEIGALAAWTPTKITLVTSYAAECYPQVFTAPSTSILTVMAERTFWEKVTILHKEAFRTNGNLPMRYSRHYYDLYCMDKSCIKARAFADLNLLERVVAFKARFYPTNSARYDLAHPDTIRLMPPTNCETILAEDYEQMKNMIFGDRPSFNEVMDTLRHMEVEINALA